MKISELMEQGDVNFGTSGIRAHESKLTDEICYACMKGLLQFYSESGMIKPGGTFAIAGDLRDSTDRIMLSLAKAVKDSGYNLINSGKIPTPAITLFGIENGFVSGMVTASHNPGDNNGFKPNTNIGELMKHHEPMMKSQVVTIPDGLFDEKGMFQPGVATSLPAVDDRAEKAFIQRYLDIFPHDLMKGMRVGVFQHKAVGRDMLAEVLKGLGAEVIILKRTESFMQVDTEAVPEEVVEWGRQWTKEHNLNALFMMDPDSDRPLAAGPSGNWWRGDVLGIVAAWALDADFVATPVSCNTALEKSGLVPQIKRTRIGSPYVIEAMLEAVKQGCKRVVGYEANGGFLVQSDIPFEGKVIKALPTRDSFLPMLLLVHQAKKLG
ncbi:MAG: phosphomannomutase, partial [Pseudomonadota bacterium]